MRGFIVASTHTDAGKTTISLGLMQALKNRGYCISPFKCGPDYLDPKLHFKAVGQKSMNLDPWAMHPSRIYQLLSSKKDNFFVIEGMMGLFDGALNLKGSTADLAACLKLPVILIVNCEKQSHSIAALIYGFQNFRKDIAVKGVILNKVKHQKQELFLRQALKLCKIDILGVIYEHPDFVLSARYLGLIDRNQNAALDLKLTKITEKIETFLDIEKLLQLVKKTGNSFRTSCDEKQPLPPLGQHMAIAQDEAFSFLYPHLLEFWKKSGASFSFFSPLKDESPDDRADAIFLPGGYPELYGEILQNNKIFKKAMKKAALKQKLIYGECGGYMVLGKTLEDKDGHIYEMLDLLPHQSSIKQPKLQLGYRKAVSKFIWSDNLLFMHEFHYSTTKPAAQKNGNLSYLFEVKNALNEDLGPMGLKKGSIMGSYLHIIDSQPII